MARNRYNDPNDDSMFAPLPDAIQAAVDAENSEKEENAQQGDTWPFPPLEQITVEFQCKLRGRSEVIVARPAAILDPDPSVGLNGYAIERVELLHKDGNSLSDAEEIAIDHKYVESAIEALDTKLSSYC